MNKNSINNDYVEFDGISLMDVREFFTKNVFQSLVEKYNILTLGDLFRQTDNGNLYLMIKKNVKSLSGCEDFQRVIKGTVNLLKGKYLKENLPLDENSSLEDISIKMGISRYDIVKLKYARVYNLGQLMEMAKFNNFSILYNQPRWIRDKVEVLVNKLRLLFDIYYHGKNNHNDYTQFKDLPLTETQDFFTSMIFKYLINKFGIFNVGDLFAKEETGELYQLICGERTISRFEREDICVVVRGTINLLKCKYLNKELSLNENSSIEECRTALGISFWDFQKMARINIKTLGNLLDMVKRDDFSELHYTSWRKERINIIINKTRLVYELFYGQKNILNLSTIDRETEANILVVDETNDLSVLKIELQELYDELKQLLNKKQTINCEIAQLEDRIEKVLAKKLVFERK